MEATWWTQPSQLDADQQKVVSLPLDGDHLIVGPPGSGKTNLLILRATYLYRSKVRDTVILTFGRVLKEFLASGSTNYEFSSDKIQTYIKWATMLLKEHGVLIDDSKKFDDVRRDILAGFNIIINSGQEISKHDCILIDEAQDYSADEIDVIRKFTKAVFAVGDDKQRIYQTNGAIAVLKGCCHIATLNFHYRNGIRICRVADGITDQLDRPGGLEASSQYDESVYQSSVLPFPGLTIEEQVAKAIPEIATQLRAYPGEAIGVLCPRHTELEQVGALLEQSALANNIQLQRHSDGYGALSTDRRIIVTTLHSAKGLEFRALHLMGMDKISAFRALQKRMAFTGVTRAKTSLSIYYDKPLPGYLERGIVSV